jgi:hypothetical protein
VKRELIGPRGSTAFELLFYQGKRNGSPGASSQPGRCTANLTPGALRDYGRRVRQIQFSSLW